AVFRKKVVIPVGWSGKDRTLSLGPIDDYDSTFFNGVEVGFTGEETPDCWRVPRVYTVPARLVKPGESVIAVRVFDHFGVGGFTGKPEQLFLKPKE
ncbi:unnamed protein product, partial [marine sediment metagenome]